MFQGMGNTLPPLASSLMRLLLFAVPAYALASHPGFQMRHVWYVSLAAVVGLLYYGRPLLAPVAFALFLAFALRPFVSLLERARVPRIAAILMLLFVLIGAIVLLVINVTAQLNLFYSKQKNL